MGAREERRERLSPDDEQALGVRPHEMASRERGGGCGAPECEPRPIDCRQRLAGAAGLQDVQAGRLRAELPGKTLTILAPG